MARAPGDESEVGGVVPDLVEYLVVVVQDLESLATVVPALGGLVERSAIRILDLVIVSREADGMVMILEPEAVPSLAEMEGEIGGLLSEHDLELVSFALEPGKVGMVVVTEDRWAESLSRAAHRAGGLILAGERIPANRVEIALGERFSSHPAVGDVDPPSRA